MHASVTMAAASPALKHTPLYALHLEAGARFTAFAGYDMPVQYQDGIVREHLHTRAHAGLFDISHMGQISLRGDARATALESLTPADVTGLPTGRQRYALLTSDRGGIIDDIMIANLGDELILVVNAARMAAVFKHLSTALAGRCAVTALADLALLALQGPEAAAVLARLAPALAAMPFQTVARQPFRLHRRGRLRDRAARRQGRTTGAPAAGGAGGQVHRPRRARFAAAGGRAVPVRPRHRRADLRARGRSGVDHCTGTPSRRRPRRRIPRRRGAGTRARDGSRGAARRPAAGGQG